MLMGPARWMLIACLAVCVPLQAAAPSKEEELKAAKEASNEADKWAAAQPAANPVKPSPPAVVTPVPAASLPGVAASPTPALPSDPNAAPAADPATAPAQTVAPSAAPAHAAQLAPLKPGYNEMVGTILNVEQDPNVLRISLENGYNVGFTYDEKSVMTNGGGPLKVSDLYFGDTVQVRYFGKELRITEIERLKKSPRPTLGQ